MTCLCSVSDREEMLLVFRATAIATGFKDTAIKSAINGQDPLAWPTVGEKLLSELQVVCILMHLLHHTYTSYICCHHTGYSSTPNN